MKTLISEKLSIYGILFTLSLIILFHLLVISGIIPFGIVWGGRLKSQSEMLQFESLSIGINLIMVGIVAARAGFINAGTPPILIRIALFLMAGLFFLNTLGNLLSTSQLEKIIFTPLTAILFLFSLRLAISKPAEVKKPPIYR